MYELHIANASSEPLALESVSVRGADGAVLAEFAGKALGERLALTSAGAAPGDAAPLAPAQKGVVYVELEFPSGRVPRTVGHSVTYRAATQSPTRSVSTRQVPVDQSQPTVLGPPLAGGTWVTVHHPGWPRGHRRVFFDIDGRQRLPGRFAIDFVKVDRAGTFAAGDPDVVGNAHGYGADVLAVADAVVVAARDDMGETSSVAANTKHPPRRCDRQLCRIGSLGRTLRPLRAFETGQRPRAEGRSCQSRTGHWKSRVLGRFDASAPAFPRRGRKRPA